MIDNLNNLIEKTVILNNGNTYQFIWVTKFNEKNYSYLININDFSDIIFCEITREGLLIEINDKNELLQIIKIITKEINTFTR